MINAVEQFAARVEGAKFKGPTAASFRQFLEQDARILQRNGTTAPYEFQGRAPINLAVTWLDKIFSNTLDKQTVEIDGVTFRPGELKGAIVVVGGGAGFGKTITELNLMAYLTAVRFCAMANYLPDREKLQEIVDLKFRPNMLDLYPWFARMISLGKTENASGKSVHRKESYTVTDGQRTSFGHFAGMHKPPTSIHFDVCALDEVDDIDLRYIGYVSGRMTNSAVALTIFIGTQRLAGAGQNARLESSSCHVKFIPCKKCGAEWNLEENFPRIVRVAATRESAGRKDNPVITAEMGHDRRAYYYCACLDCGMELDRDDGAYRAKNPHRVNEAKLGLRVSQLNISAISMQEIVGAWYAAFEDPSGYDMVAFYCDRIAIPNAGAAQPITQQVLDRSRGLQKYSMSLTPARSALGAGIACRFAGLDMGPRCWFWCDEVEDKFTSSLVWAELIASGSLPARLPILMQHLGIECVFLDAGGEPDLTKRMCLALNGLEDYRPPNIPQTELLKAHLGNLGAGLTWDGTKAQWRGLRAAAVLFVNREARGVEQTIGFTQDGKIYPLIKVNRSESIQTAVNDFLTPAEGVIELVEVGGGVKRQRELPRARLPHTYIGAGAKQSVLDGHLLNLRKVKNERTGEEDWADKVENHLGLAKVYARLAATQAGLPSLSGAFDAETISQVRMGANRAAKQRHFEPRRLILT